MNIDLGSPVLDIAIGLSFVFFLLSLIVSAVREFFAGLFSLRSKTLVKGVEGMLGDAEVAGEVLEHPLVRTDLRKEKPAKNLKNKAEVSGIQNVLRRERGPSYISPRNFSVALHEILEKVLQEQKEKELKEKAAGAPPVAETKTPAEEERGRLLKQVNALASKWQPDKAPPIESIEKWFDESMDRVSGWYKRTSQWWMVGIALLVAVGLNASAIRIVERLEAEPTVRAAVVKEAETALGSAAFKTQVKEEEETEGKNAEDAKAGAAKQIKSAGDQTSKAIGEIDELKLPLWWAGENVPQDWSQIGLAIVGWLITAIAISLGAPFWFDALGKLANLRMAGKNPEEKEKK